MSEPKRGKHRRTCMKNYPDCPCNTCQYDRWEYRDEIKQWCCDVNCGKKTCALRVADEPTKKGA